MSQCACDAAKPESLAARECSLCREVEKYPLDSPILFIKDANPSKPNRWLALPRAHGPVGHRLANMDPAERTKLWAAAIEKATAVWGDKWGIAYNGDKVRTQCHAHIHIGKLLPGIETSQFIVVDGPDRIPAPDVDGFWIHPQDGKLHVHTGEQITETVLLR